MTYLAYMFAVIHISTSKLLRQPRLVKGYKRQREVDIERERERGGESKTELVAAAGCCIFAGAFAVGVKVIS